jgi:hypothetical protein
VDRRRQLFFVGQVDDQVWLAATAADAQGQLRAARLPEGRAGHLQQSGQPFAHLALVDGRVVTVLVNGG